MASYRERVRGCRLIAAHPHTAVAPVPYDAGPKYRPGLLILNVTDVLGQEGGCALTRPIGQSRGDYCAAANLGLHSSMRSVGGLRTSSVFGVPFHVKRPEERLSPTLHSSTADRAFRNCTGPARPFGRRRTSRLG